MGRAVAQSQRRAVWSRLPVKTDLPSGLKATAMTEPRCVERLADLLAGGRVPQPGRVVHAAGHQRLAVGAEGHGEDPALMEERRVDRRAGRGLPEPRRAVVTAGHHGLAVGAEGRGRDPALVLHGLADGLAGRRIPEPRCLVDAAGQDRLAVGAKRDRVDGPGMLEWGVAGACRWPCPRAGPASRRSQSRSTCRRG